MSFILVITGPTASGKTGFAIECAKKYNGEIVSCDSMQIYKGLDIGTAKATPDEQNAVRHHLIDVINYDENFSVQQFVQKARCAIDQIISKGKLPIIVGGTGLYINSLLHEYSFANTNKNNEIREYYNNLLQERGNEYLHSLLEQVDKESAQKIHVNDTKRIIRALEIFKTTGITKSKLNTENKYRYESLILVLNMEREVLYDRINRRVDRMFECGLIDEFNNVIRLNKQSSQLQSMQAIGYKELFEYLNEKLTLEETKELIKKNTRNYAKRQLTFFRGMENAIFIDINHEKNKAFNLIEDALSKNGLKL